MNLLQRLSFNQMTADPWSLEKAVRSCAAKAACPTSARGVTNSMATLRRHPR
jgi:hypothetical protein